MNNEKQTLPVRMDGYTRFCLTVIAVLLTVMIIGLWADKVHLAETANAKAKGSFVESSTKAHMIRLVKAQDKTTAKMDELIRLLKSGQVKVTVTEAAPAPKGIKNVPSKTR